MLMRRGVDVLKSLMSTRAQLNYPRCSANSRLGLKSLTAYNEKCFNLTMKYEEGLDAVSTTIPGLSFGNFNRLGIPAVWTVALEFDMHRFSKVLSPAPPSSENSEADFRRVVIAANKYLFTPLFYEKAALDFPMVHKTGRKLITDKIICTEASLSDAEVGALLVSNSRISTFMDFNTRRPLPIPDYLKKSSVYQPDGKAFRIKAFEKPEDHYRFHVKVAHSDTDLLAHLNQSGFMKYMMDASAEATHTGYFKLFKGDFFSYKAKEIEIAYKGECFVGDILAVCVWETIEGGELKVNFLVESKGNVVGFGSGTFYSKENA